MPKQLHKALISKLHCCSCISDAWLLSPSPSMSRRHCACLRTYTCKQIGKHTRCMWPSTCVQQHAEAYKALQSFTTTNDKQCSSRQLPSVRNCHLAMQTRFEKQCVKACSHCQQWQAILNTWYITILESLGGSLLNAAWQSLSVPYC